MTPQRVTLITLGVGDLAAAKAFYARLGWREHGANEGVRGGRGRRWARGR